jgi:hypothetical protein
MHSRAGTALLVAIKDLVLIINIQYPCTIIGGKT